MDNLFYLSTKIIQKKLSYTWFGLTALTLSLRFGDTTFAVVDSKFISIVRA